MPDIEAVCRRAAEGCIGVIEEEEEGIEVGRISSCRKLALSVAMGSLGGIVGI